MDNPRVEVRAMTAADIPAAVALWQVTEGMGLGESDSPEALGRFLARHAGLSAVAVADGGRLVGAVLCGDDERRGYLHHLAVAREFRRRGLAGRMLDHCFRGLAARGIPKCNLFLFADHVAGEAFWLAQGWTHRRDLKVMQKVVRAVPPAASAGD